MTDNEWACLQSHLTALKWAKENDFECVAIFEDDVVFLPTFKSSLSSYLSKLPTNWHILYLGGSFGRRPEFFDEYFSKQKMTWGAFAYVVHNRAYDNLIERLSRGNKIVDAVYIEYQNKYLCLKPHHQLVKHPAGFSTIKERNVDYKNIV
jgi:GR25 family glycosyltransferase involved in LPS biosynthesis